MLRGRVSSTVPKSLANLFRMFPKWCKSKNFMVALTTDNTIDLCKATEARPAKVKWAKARHKRRQTEQQIARV
jgi:hypothetical protein